MANPRNQPPIKYPVIANNGLISTPWSFYFQTFNNGLAPVGEGYILDGTAVSVGPTKIFQDSASNRGSTPSSQSIYFAPDTGQIFTVAEGSWQEQTPAFTGDVLKNAFSNVTTLADVNPSPGTFGNNFNIPIITTNTKGQITGITSVPLVAPPATASGVNGSIQINTGGFLGSDLDFTYDTSTETLELINQHVDGVIDFLTPLPTFNNLSPLTTIGDLLTFDGTNNIRQSVGNDGEVLSADSLSSSGLSWKTTGRTEVVFNFGDATPKNIYLVAANKIIISVSIIITTAFDDVSSTLSLGRLGFVNELLATTDNLPSVAGTYTDEPGIKYGSATQITLSISSGTSTQGSGLVIVEYQN